ncbi:hypothetical protein D917_08009 [Trichinella nativa]|uniref:Uncharacterized protein n=1 Tax=Trichinella nativa TaxID=6335 RepID=A0A1Y3EQD7_9BILA|nr:hypothetical protein D917_08009 [Trichinella nativa]
MKAQIYFPSLSTHCMGSDPTEGRGEGFFSVCQRLCQCAGRPVQTVIAEGLCMEQVQNVTAVSAYSVLRNANYCAFHQRSTAPCNTDS